MAAKDAQKQLTAEVQQICDITDTPFLILYIYIKNIFVIIIQSTQLQELGEKYLECIEMLHEAQEELKNLRNRSVSAGTPRRFHPLGLFPMVHKHTLAHTLLSCIAA